MNRSSARGMFLAGVIYAALLALPSLILFPLKPLLTAWLGNEWWYAPFSMTFVSATVAPLLYTNYQRRIQERLLSERKQYQETLIQGALGMTLIKELKRLLNLIVHTLTRTMRVEHASVWLRDKEKDHFILKATRGHDGIRPGDTLPKNDPILQVLLKTKRPLVRQRLRTRAQSRSQTIPLMEELSRLRAEVAIPSFVKGELVGFVAMSEKRSGEYTDDDLGVFEVLASQATLAIENAQFYEDLKETQAELFQTAKLASLGQMAGGMSHQINNRFHVLTILAGTMKAVLKDLDPASVEMEKLKVLWAKMLETFGKIEENAIRGGDIVKTLLRFSRPGKVEAQPISVKDIVAMAWDVAQYRIDVESVDFVLEWPPALPQVVGNLNQLAECFVNLITNAYDATQSKKEKMNLPDYRGKILISGHPAVNGMVSIDVQDTGTGITRDQLDQLFVPFFTTKATVEKGTGLGLFVIKRILEHHGGTIDVHSVPGEGTTFTISLPSAETKTAVA